MFIIEPTANWTARRALHPEIARETLSAQSTGDVGASASDGLRAIVGGERETGWNHLILRYLWQHRREEIPLWRLVNELVRQFQPRTRGQARDVSRSILADLSRLIGTKKVIRYRRRYVALHPSLNG